jgi:hypothetical protein
MMSIKRGLIIDSSSKKFSKQHKENTTLPDHKFLSMSTKSKKKRKKAKVDLENDFSYSQYPPDTRLQSR